MRIVIAFILSTFLTPTILAQGLVAFNNNPSTLVTSGNPGNTAPIAGATGSYYFALLTSPSGLPGTFSFAGNYATNSASAPGRFIGGTQSVSGWAPGTSMFYEVFGWSASLGATWNPLWLAGNFGAGLFGISSVASGTSGGGTPPAPPFPLFGGTGINQGFNMQPPSFVPEPSAAALIAVGAAVILFCLSRQKRKLRSSLASQ